MPTKLLVVEDNADAREILKLLLLQEGYNIVTAEDGNEGLEKAKAESPHLIVTDLHMPGLHGLELIKQLRQIPELSIIPILILTADVDGKEQAIEAGASSVLIKPTGYEKLAETIKHLLEMS